MKIRALLPALSAALILTGVTTAAPAMAADPPPPITGYHHLRNAAYNQCVDAPGGRLNVRLRLAPCGPSTTQQWDFQAVKLVRNTYWIYILANRASLKRYCMEVNQGTSNPGETVDEFTCGDGSSSAFHWEQQGLQFRHEGTNQCLDTVGGRDSELMQYTCGQESPPGAQGWVVQ